MLWLRLAIIALFPSFDFNLFKQLQKRAQCFLCCSTNARLELGLLGLCLLLCQLQNALCLLHASVPHLLSLDFKL